MTVMSGTTHLAAALLAATWLPLAAGPAPACEAATPEAHAGAAPLAVIVTRLDAEGVPRPLAGARVTLAPAAGGGTVTTGETGEDGRALLVAPEPGTYLLTVDLPECREAARRTLEIGRSPEPVEITLGPFATLLARVLDAEGEAVPGAVVRLDGANASRAAMTDAVGKARIACAPAGVALDVTVLRPGVVPARFERLSLEAGERRPLTLHLPPDPGFEVLPAAPP